LQDKQLSRRFLVYRRVLLPGSETFIPGQANSIPGWKPKYLGFKLSEGPLLDSLDTVLRPSPSDFIARPRLAAFAIRGRLPHRVDVDSGRYEFVHAHFGIDASQCLNFSRRHRLPLIATFHGYDITVRDDVHDQSRLGRWYVRERPALFRDARLIIAVSEFIRDRLLEAGADPARTIRHYIGVDLPAARYQPLQRRDGLLFVGRLVPKKGLGTVLQALAAWPGGAAPPLTVIGDGPDRQQLERFASATRLNVTFLGSQPHSEVLGGMTRARLLCLPSQQASDGDEEGLGLVGLEAQVRGLPVVASKSGGIPEFVVDGSTGLLAPPATPEAWRTALQRAYDDDALLERLATSAFEASCARFDRRRQCLELAELYERAATQVDR
jgi:colanic acid/amylovoran biosynthesis glycosyltransferase